MSLKSFDKFCEKLIMNEPMSNKDIFDERQNQLRQRILSRAFMVFAYSSTLNTLIMESGLQWCESYFCATIIFAAVSYIYYLAACSKADALVGINGAKGLRFSAVYMIIMCSFFLFIYDYEDLEPGENFFFHDGMLSGDFIMIILDILGILCGITALLLLHKYKKKKPEKTDSDIKENKA